MLPVALPSLPALAAELLALPLVPAAVQPPATGQKCQLDPAV